MGVAIVGDVVILVEGFGNAEVDMLARNELGNLVIVCCEGCINLCPNASTEFVTGPKTVCGRRFKLY